jgi:hypothetical protein
MDKIKRIEKESEWANERTNERVSEWVGRMRKHWCVDIWQEREEY